MLILEQQKTFKDAMEQGAREEPGKENQLYRMTIEPFIAGCMEVLEEIDA